MANTVISPDMNLPIPVVGTDPGPDWANNINACLGAIDSHNHSSGQGVPVTPAGIAINADLPFNNNNAITLRSTNFVVQGSPLSDPTDLGCIYVSGVDLYYNDEAGNQIRITSAGNVNAGAGSITGLPSGTASVTFAGTTFTFQSSTATPATMAVGPLVIGAAVASSKTVTLSPNVAQAANYAITFPVALPVATSIQNVDATGQIGFVAPDNTTFGIQTTQYGVLDGGITTPQLGNNSVTTAKIFNGSVTYPKLATATFDIGAQGGTFSTGSTTYVSVTGTGATIAAPGGRNVLLVFGPDFNSGAISTIAGSGGSQTTNIRILRGATVIGETQLSFGSSYDIPPSLTCIDIAPAAATYTYVVQVKVSSLTISIENTQLFAQVI